VTERREKRMLLAIKEAQPAVPQTVRIENVKVPKMTKNEDAEIFIKLFEAALNDNGIREDKWKEKLHAALDTTSKLKVKGVITDHT